MADFDTGYSADLFGEAGKSPISSSMLELKNNYEAIKSLIPAGGLPLINGYIDPGESYKYSVQALTNFSSAYMGSKPLSSDLIKFVASAGLGNGLNLLNGPLMTINSVVSQISGTDVIANASEFVKSPFGKSMTGGGVGGTIVEGAMGVATVTFDALADGKVTYEEGKAIVQSVATFACAAIGAAVGGVAGPIGSAVGIIIGQIIQLFQPPPPPVIDAKFLENVGSAMAAQELFNKLMVERQKVVAFALSNEASYWNSVDKFMLEFGNRWSKAEQSIGFKFGLRWFEDARGPAFYMPPGDLARVGSRWAINYQEKLSTDINQANFQTFIVEGKPSTRCLLPMSGCPYPSMNPFYGSIPKGYIDSQKGRMFSDGLREAKALAARGVVWANPDQRLDVDRYIPYPTSQYLYSGDAGVRAYLNMLGEKQKEIAVKQSSYRGAQLLLDADLARTTAVMQGYITMLANKAKYKATGLNLNEISSIGEVIEKRSALLNNTALMAGLGVLGYSIYRTVKR